MREVSEEKRAKLLAELKEAEARIKAGDYIEYDPKTLKDRMMRIYREARARPLIGGDRVTKNS